MSASVPLSIQFRDPFDLDEQLAAAERGLDEFGRRQARGELVEERPNRRSVVWISYVDSNVYQGVERVLER